MNKKNGLGVKTYKNKKIDLIGHWIEDDLDGLAILISLKNEEEKFIYFEKDKTKNEVYDSEEIRSIRESLIYKEMMEFYANIVTLE